jgi:hypothetical protein
MLACSFHILNTISKTQIKIMFNHPPQADINCRIMADLQKDDRRDERAEKTPSSESTQRTPQDTNLRKDDASKKEDDRGAANTGMGRQDSNAGRSSGNVSSGSGNAGSQTPNRGSSGTGQNSGRDADKDKGGMKR